MVVILKGHQMCAAVAFTLWMLWGLSAIWLFGGLTGALVHTVVLPSFTRMALRNHRVDARTVAFAVTDKTAHNNTVLILISIGPSDPYGRNRRLEDVLELIHSTEYDPQKISLGFLIVDPREFEAVDRTMHRYYESVRKSHIHSTLLIHAPFFEKANLNREDRHADSVQKERRRILARARNYLLYSSLTTQDYVLWLDADIGTLPKRILQRFVESQKDIITIRVTQLGAVDYDRNAWVGLRAKPSAEELGRMRKDPEYIFVPHNGPHTKNIHAFMHGLEEFVELDSVGGTVLFVKAEIHRQGVTHTPYYAIGTDFGLKEGYDGIETEGLCYVAKTLGYKCWGMPLVSAEHFV